MPDMQTTPQPAALVSAMEAGTLARFDDADLALGFECANPALQIERWQLEAAGVAEAH